LIEEWDRKKYDTTRANPSSSTCAVSFTQTNLHASGPSADDTSMPNPFAQSVNHFHSRSSVVSCKRWSMPAKAATTTRYARSF
jgi:hypothetical protein